MYQYIGTSKISKLNPKLNLTYPLIRLPQRYATVIGKTAHIYESLEEGQKAIVLVFDETESNDAENKKKIMQPVIKRIVESDFTARIEVLEEEIKKLRTLIEKEAHLTPNIQQTNGPGRIRTGDLRRVKTEAFEHPTSFSHSSVVWSEALVGAITTKNASAP